jgi:hypothetical protein
VGIFRQSQRDERLLVLPVPAVRHDQQVRRIEINDPAVQDGGLSPWIHHPSAVTAHAKVDLGHGGPHIHRSPPVHQLIGVGEPRVPVSSTRWNPQPTAMRQVPGEGAKLSARAV